MRMGFEPTRAEHNGLAVHRLNHSATSSTGSLEGSLCMCICLCHRVLQVKVSEVNKLTPRVIRHAEEVVKGGEGESRRLGQLQVSSHQWAGHVRQLIQATQQANYPWSETAERLVSSAKQGKGVEKQV